MRDKTEKIIADKTGMSMCDSDCSCGDNNGLWWWPATGSPPDWVPGWMNGAGSDEIYRWLKENGIIE